MRYGIWTILYVMALLAAALATFGVGGILAAIVVLTIWGIIFSTGKPIEVLAVLLLLVICVMCLLPAMSKAQSDTIRMRCLFNLKELGYALWNYHEEHGGFPPVYVADENGKPIHSWRVLILPYLEEKALYDSYRFDEPWNGPNNRKLAKQVPVTYDPYECSIGPLPIGRTRFFAVVGPQTAWSDRTTKNIEGSRRIWVIETHLESSDWLEPHDLSFEEAVDLLSKPAESEARDGHRRSGEFFYHASRGRNVMFSDGSVHFLPHGIPREVAAALLTVGSDADTDALLDEYARRKLNWSRIYSLSVFIVLALLPASWVRRARRERKTGDA